jgi:uncharacterized protein YbjT (DUF2867 family)
MKTLSNINKTNERILVLTANGKTGKRVADRLEQHGLNIRRGSRSARIPFDWHAPNTWAGALQGITAVYVVYTPDLAVPAAPEAIQQFTTLAVRLGVGRFVLLSGRGEVEAQRCESIVQDAGVEWTIVRASWFNQNFSEGDFLELVLGGVMALPAGSISEPFIDADDIADVVVAALTESGHAGKVYEVTGPRLLTFAEAMAEITRATGRSIEYVPITPDQFEAGLMEQQTPKDMVWLLKYLFNEVLDGRNAYVANGVQQALGRPPRDFTDFAHTTATGSVWKTKEDDRTPIQTTATNWAIQCQC